MKNEDTIKKVKGAITDATHIDMVKTPLSFMFEDGVMIMDGSVEEISTKKKAVIAARNVLGKDKVVDRINIKPAIHMDDLEIADHFQEILDQEYTLEGQSINTRVSQGIIYLDGEVHSLAHKRLAEVLAWWVPGSVNVVNSIVVNPSERDSDDEITDTVKLVFEKDKLVREGSVLVKTKDAVVTLTGMVKSTAATDAAEDDVWCIFGVRDVVNKLEVG